MATHNYYQPKGVSIHLKPIGPRNWAWRTCDFFYNEIEKGDGCKTKKAARKMARASKVNYMASIEVTKVKLTVHKRIRKKPATCPRRPHGPRPN